ncbi:hypothetical protein MPR_2803 [Myroides profundi]|nr:hypothetical protein MPR_2803 [Myroides profundi]
MVELEPCLLNNASFIFHLFSSNELIWIMVNNFETSLNSLLLPIHK